MTDTMQELLAQWHERDKERCPYDPEHGLTTYFYPHDKDMYEEKFLYCDVDSPLGYVVLQGAVQTAIETRGWWWALKNNGRSAYVSDGYEVHGASHGLPRPALNLLSAYMQALEVAKDA